MQDITIFSTLVAALPSITTGLTLSLSLIVAIGAQNTFVLRQGLRREHVAAVVAVCALLDMGLMTLGVSGLAATLGNYPRALNALGLAGAAVVGWYGLSALRRAFAPHAMQAQLQGAPQSLQKTVLQTLSISLLNPHVYLDTVISGRARWVPSRPQARRAGFWWGPVARARCGSSPSALARVCSARCLRAPSPGGCWMCR